MSSRQAHSGGPQDHPRSRPRQRRDQLGRLLAGPPSPGRGGARQQGRAGRVPRPVHVHRRDAHSTQLQWQPASPRLRARAEARAGSARCYFSGRAARSETGRDDVRFTCRACGRSRPFVDRPSVGQRLPGRRGLSVAGGGHPVLEGHQRSGPRHGREGLHRDAPAQRGLQPGHDGAARV